MKRSLVVIILLLLIAASSWYVWSSGLLNTQDEDVHLTFERNAPLLDDVVIAEIAPAACAQSPTQQICYFCRPDVVYLASDGLLRGRSTVRLHKVPLGESATLDNIIGQTSGAGYVHSADLTMTSAEQLLADAKAACSTSLPTNSSLGEFVRIHEDAGLLP